MYLKKIAVFIISLFVAGCSLGPESIFGPKKITEESLSKKIITESGLVGEKTKKLRESIERDSKNNISIEPVAPVYNPLEDHIVSFSVVDEDYKFILYSLARSFGINLIIDPLLSDEKHLVTMNFEKVPAATVMDELLNSFDFYYVIENNIIRVSPFAEKIFKLACVDIDISTNFEVGGDVLGGGEEGSSSGLAGTFKLSGKGTEKGNSYDVIEKMLEKLMQGEKGKFYLNRLSGSLYVKSTPSMISSISRMINHFNQMLSRQILIEARIIEVTLSDKYKYGIDWEVLRKENSTAAKLNSASWSSGMGLVLSGIDNAFTINAALDALNEFGDTTVISNPNIRSKHGKPAIISVGTSYTYKKSVETTSESTSTETRDTTEVEVSTVFDGLILGVIPFIDEQNRITLLINPIKSDVDPSSLQLENVSDDQSISLPVVNIKEMNSTIILKSGDVVILGGLIDKRTITKNSGIPIVSAIPFIGYLFKNQQESQEIRELAIILSVTVI